MTTAMPSRLGRTVAGTARALGIGVLLALVALPRAAKADGSKAFVARPVIGQAVLQLPSIVSWHAEPMRDGAYRVTLTAEMDLRPALRDIKTLSAKALDRSKPCEDAVKVLGAAARITGPKSVKYDLRFHFVKRVCAGSYPVELPADVSCSAKISLSAQRSIITVDVKGATEPPCTITGVYKSVSDAVYAIVGIDVFKRHTIDLAAQLPPEFKGVTINIRSFAFARPPAAPKFHVSGESIMSQAQFADVMARLEKAAPQPPQVN
jgi:hypothetical protein